jgi:hypothetical protein
LVHFVYQKDHFTKTGLGQTSESTRKRSVFLQHWRVALVEEAEEEGQAAAELEAGAEVVVSKEQMRPAQGRHGAGAASAAGSKL